MYTSMTEKSEEKDGEMKEIVVLVVEHDDDVRDTAAEIRGSGARHSITCGACTVWSRERQPAGISTLSCTSAVRL